MKLAELRECPTRLTIGSNGTNIHETVFRSYSMLNKVCELLMSDQPVPPKVILEMIEDVMNAPAVFRDLHNDRK